jgi:hypothetical protein
VPADSFERLAGRGKPGNGGHRGRSGATRGRRWDGRPRGWSPRGGGGSGATSGEGRRVGARACGASRALARGAPRRWDSGTTGLTVIRPDRGRIEQSRPLRRTDRLPSRRGCVSPVSIACFSGTVSEPNSRLTWRFARIAQGVQQTTRSLGNAAPPLGDCAITCPLGDARRFLRSRVSSTALK